MVALVVFALASTGLAAGFASAMRSSGVDRDRATAAGLAQRELEIVRNAFRNDGAEPPDAVNPNPLPGGVAGRPLVVDGRRYTVTRTVQLLTNGVGKSPCDGGALAEYPAFAVRVEVDWPNRPTSVKPVEVDTVLTPPKNTLATATNVVTVKVLGADGGPGPGRTVTLKKGATVVGTDMTGGDGCAVFVTAGTGLHDVVLSMDGYVDNNGVQSVTKSVNVTASSFSKVTFSYDEAASIPVRLVTAPGHHLPEGVRSATLGSTSFFEGSRTYSAGPAVTTISGLWPAQDGYSAWPGSCAQSDPAAAGGTRTVQVTVAPGRSSDLVDLRLAPVTVTVTGPVGAVAGARVRAYPVDETGCAASEIGMVVGTTDGSGAVKTSLPAGSWRLAVDGWRSPVDRNGDGDRTDTVDWETFGGFLPNAAPRTVNVQVAP